MEPVRTVPFLIAPGVHHALAHEPAKSRVHLTDRQKRRRSWVVSRVAERLALSNGAIESQPVCVVRRNKLGGSVARDNAGLILLGERPRAIELGKVMTRANSRR